MPIEMFSVTSHRLPPVIIFSNLSGSDAVESSKLNETFTREALASYGNKIVHGHVNPRREKHDLYLITNPFKF
jgi:hypothetical protein